jgi:DNA-binding SARP family transcriptional activator/TPR repeat protein
MIELKTLGRLELSGGEDIDSSAHLTQSKRFALLVYLALPTPGTVHRRDTLVGLFWPELDQAHARAALRTSLSHIRHVLGDGVVVRRGAEEVGLSAEFFSCDVAAFEAAIEEGAWDTALGLYKGDLLEGVFLPNAHGFERWLEDERARLREAAAAAAWARAHQYLEGNRPVDAERLAQRALTLVATDESEVRRFVNALAAAGDRVSAIRFFEKFTERLREEYELEPSPETMAVVETLRGRGVSAKRGHDTAEEVSQSDSRAVSEAPTVMGTKGEPSRSGRRWVVGAGAAVAVAAVLTAIVVVAVLRSGSAVALDPNHVVVTAFRNATGDPSLDQLGERIGHWITRGLQQAAIPVTPWTQAVQSWEYVQTEADAGRVQDPMRTLAEETGAGVVVSGAVYLVEGDSLEVQAEITDLVRGRSLGTVDPLQAPRLSESEIIRNAQQRVMVFFAAGFHEELGDLASAIGSPPSFEAYQAYMEAVTRHFRWDITDAEPYFRLAAELDTTWVQPLIRLVMVLHNLRRLDERDSVLRVLENFDGRMSAYDDAELKWCLATLVEGDEKRATAHLRRAVELAPSSPSVYNLALYLYGGNRPREAIELLRTLNPGRGWVRGMPLYWRQLALSLHDVGEYEQELDAAQGGYEHHPENLAFFLALKANALAALGRTEELSVVLDEVKDEPDLLNVYNAFAWAPQILRARGYGEAARNVAAQAIDWFESRSENATALCHHTCYGLMLFLAGRIDDAQRVFDALVAEYPETLDIWPCRLLWGPRAHRGFVAAIRGDTALALSDLEWFQNADTVGMTPANKRDLAYNHGSIVGVLGDRERAVELIREPGWLLPLFRESVLWEPLRDYPPFQELMRPKG